MSVVNLGASRFEREDDPAKIDLADALQAALESIKADTAKHVFICIGHRCGNGHVRGEWLQAGQYDTHGQLGLLERCKVDLINSVIEAD